MTIMRALFILCKNHPQELHMYLKVWYYVIVGEGEKLSTRNTNQGFTTF